MQSAEWWLWSGPQYDVDDSGHLHPAGMHWELYAVILQDGHPSACAGPVDSGAGTQPSNNNKPILWPLNRKEPNFRRGPGLKGQFGECPFLSHQAILSTLIKRRAEFTRFPYSETFPSSPTKPSLDNRTPFMQSSIPHSGGFNP